MDPLNFFNATERQASFYHKGPTQQERNRKAITLDFKGVIAAMGYYKPQT